MMLKLPEPDTNVVCVREGCDKETNMSYTNISEVKTSELIT